MARLARLDFKGATHYVQIHGRAEYPFVPTGPAGTGPLTKRDPATFLPFRQLLTAACLEHGAALHAYALTPHLLSLVLRTRGAPLESVMRWLSGQFSRYLHAHGVVPKGETPFAARYESRVVAPAYLPHAVRRVHATSRSGASSVRGEVYSFDSEGAYIGNAVPPPFDCRPVIAALQAKGFSGLGGLRLFMAQTDTPYVANLFTHGSSLDPRIIGDRAFVVRARYAAVHPPPAPTLQAIVVGVAALLDWPAYRIDSPRRDGVLGRSLVAWYGVRFGAATLTEVAARFGLTGATLSHGIRHHRRLAPKLFDRGDLPGLHHETGTENDLSVACEF